MSLQGTIKRYTLLIEKLQHNHYPSVVDLLSLLNDQGFEISQRSMERDMSVIRNEFGIDIKFNTHRKGYFINHDNTVNFETFVRFLDIVNTSDLLMESIREGSETLNYIAFEDLGNLKGVEQIKLLINAIKNRKCISFMHFNFHTDYTKKHVLEPYLLKQYQSRWYIVGKLKGSNDFRTFGIDRMEDLTMLSDTFKRDKNKDVRSLFSNVVGLTFTDEEREIVKIEVKYPQAYYIKTLPIHSSQAIESDTKNTCVFSLYVIPNFELMQKLLIHVNHAKVLEPKSLVDDMRDVIKNMLKNYA